MKFPVEVETVFKVLRENGFAVYAVGGCVRDFLLKKTPSDFDIATDALPEEVEEIFSGYRVVLTGVKHGTVSVVFETISVEITTFRTEGQYLDNRRPSEVRFSKNIADDLKRRDFTINAIAYSPYEGYIDIFGGKMDIENRQIRCVGNAKERIAEDALRMLRALRLAAELGFKIENKTSHSIHQNKDLLKNISFERINTEFTKILFSGNAAQMLTAYRDVIEVFIPTLKNDPEYAFKVKKLDFTKDLSVKLAYLFKDEISDIEKARAKTALLSLKYDHKTICEVDCLLTYQNKKVVLGKRHIKLWMNTLGNELFFKLLELKGLDGDMQKQKCIAEEIVDNEECYSLKKLSVNGDDIIQLGIGEGIKIGEILNGLLFDVIMEKLPNNQEVLLEYVKQKYGSTGA